ncbi:hypothetical protein INT48_002226 [Thamnidium elegans]|uniref:Pyruvate decarboxylase n=1 Tax=Thamnidium elegans TaxID=101142 RepID=A0A8H7VXD6_9FUNG|nr:hypothetical protein INT48_002226 [Thamnidium elegans]
MDSDEDLDCPLCMEELDIADRNFRPYVLLGKVHVSLVFFYTNTVSSRREYSEEMVEFRPVSADDMRVVQKNLVYIIGLHPKLATEEIVRSHDFFGQFGKISKIVINKRPALPASQMSSQPSAAVYVTYYRKEDAAKAIAAVDGSVIADRVLRASYGTTKYCTYYLRNMTCPNPNCLYLHEQGEDMDTISKEELATGKHHMRGMLTTDDEDEADHDEDYHHHIRSSHTSPATASVTTSRRTPQLSNVDFPAVSSSSFKSKITDDSALPPSASWAKIGTNSSPSTPVLAVSDAFGPTLSAAVAASQQKTQFPPMPKRKSEKKKRKEQLQQQKVTPELAGDQSTEATDTAETEQEQSIFDQGLTGFVLGQAYKDLCALPSEIKQKEQEDTEEQLTLGVSALLLEDKENNAKCEPSPAQRHLEAIQSAASSVLLPVNIPSVLDFLTYSTPTSKYTGLFNPFSHLATLGTNGNNVLNASLDSPIRRHSRFAETGTTELGVFNTDSPKGVTFISQIIWGSIGYTVSASMADSRRIVYLIVGDGPFQLTSREISVYIRHGLTPVVFLLNNAGYLIEKLIHEPRRSYNNYQMWEYNKAFGFFGDHLEQNQANCKQPS